MTNLNIKLTQHARDVMAERDITLDEVAEIIARPELVLHDNSARHNDGRGPRRQFKKGDLTVIVADGGIYRGERVHVVVTILWRTQGRWTNDDMKGRKK